ncbi:MAG: prepilin-type N-terminal cleavage/methylation domain-containing protein [Deltaproteobacteria bacterium]|jgi:prepilin-type N-terminal cleavage/methylation domain-containing protein|nr:prepilin-type N-terminal cleavage/methylation domain-containing protein [Deltaproteobacteria bacterium]
MKNLISTALKSTSVSDTGRDRSRGFTLIELMVTMVVVSIIMAAIYSVYAALTRSYTTQNAAADVQQAVRATIDFMAEDIMMAGLTNPEEDYGGIDVGISVAGSTRIAFNADRNMDGDTDAADDFENITYALAGDQLQITDNTGTESLIDNVVNLQFRYFKENDTDTPTDNDLINGRDMINYHALGDPLGADDRSDIRTVEISITVEEPAGREGMIQRTYTTRVRRRNADL